MDEIIKCAAEVMQQQGSITTMKLVCTDEENKVSDRVAHRMKCQEDIIKRRLIRMRELINAQCYRYRVDQEPPAPRTHDQS